MNKCVFTHNIFNNLCVPWISMHCAWLMYILIVNYVEIEVGLDFRQVIT